MCIELTVDIWSDLRDLAGDGDGWHSAAEAE